MILSRLIMYTGGTFIGAVNCLPLPWRVKLLWARFLYHVTVKATGLIPSIWDFVETQNVTYKMGKGRHTYQPIVHMQKVLEHAVETGIPIERVRKIVDEAESEGVPEVELAFHIANQLFDEHTIRRLLTTSPTDSQTW